MSKIIEIIPLSTQYSLIIIEKDNKMIEHKVSSHGWFPLDYWIKYFEKK